MKLRIDQEACTGHGRCYSLAPDLFDADDYGHGVLIEADGTVAPADEEKAKLAVANCPEGAISFDAE